MLQKIKGLQDQLASGRKAKSTLESELKFVVAELEKEKAKSNERLRKLQRLINE
jgi:hypothetical protein